MRKKAYVMMLALGLLVAVTSGCESEKSPKSVVLRFIGAVKASDAQTIDKSLSFNRLAAEDGGLAYERLSPEGKALYVEGVRQKVIKSLTTGKLRDLGYMEPRVDNVRVSGSRAQVRVFNRKKEADAYLFNLIKENGVWKIYGISPA